MGGKRSHRSLRCIGCRMLLELCICEAVPQVRSRARFVFVLHPSERYKTTNTGRLAAKSLVGASAVQWVGRTEPCVPSPDLGPPGAAAILFPPTADEPPALPAAQWADATARAGLDPVVVVPDGTWAQCRKMVAKHPRLAPLPRLSLDAGAHPRGGLRIECLRSGMSTIDAVAWLVEALDGPDAAAPIAALHRTMLERTMASRGTPLPDGPTMNELLARG